MALALTIVGVLGNITAMALYISPTLTFWRIFKKKSTEAFSALPYACTLLNCLLWTFYGTPWVVNDIFIVTVCGLGAAFEFIYLLLFSFYAVNKKRRIRVLGYLGTVFSVFTVVVILNMLIVHKHSGRKVVVGSLAVASCGIMYASPLSVMKRVVLTKSTEFMPFWLSLASLVNGAVWTLYATLSHDIFLWIQGGIGTVLGAVQLILYACYCGPITSTVAQASESEEVAIAKTDLEKVVKAVDPDVETGQPVPQP